MSKISDWYFRLFGAAKLRGYELASIEGWKRVLGVDGAKLIEAQLGVRDLVQRTAHDRLVCLYSMRSANRAELDSRRFPLREESSLAAVLRIRRVGAPRQSTRVTVTLVDGVLFSLEFQHSPNDFAWAGVAADSFEVDGVDALIDPMTPQRAGRGRVPAGLAEFASEWGVDGVRAPLDQRSREHRVSALGLWLPDDYTSLAEECDGLRLGPVRIRGIAELDMIPVGDAGMAVFVEGRSGARYGVLRNGVPAIYRISAEDDQPEQVGTTLHSVLELELRR